MRIWVLTKNASTWALKSVSKHFPHYQNFILPCEKRRMCRGYDFCPRSGGSPHPSRPAVIWSTSNEYVALLPNLIGDHLASTTIFLWAICHVIKTYWRSIYLLCAPIFNTLLNTIRPVERAVLKEELKIWRIWWNKHSIVIKTYLQTLQCLPPQI